MPNSVWRTQRRAPGRGGLATRGLRWPKVEGASTAEWRSFLPITFGRAESMPLFDAPGATVTVEHMWINYVYFLDVVLPVVSQAVVKIALHPDDPPVPMLGGVARIFKSPEDFKRAWVRYRENPAWGLDLCLGCCSEMPGGAANVREVIEIFGRKGRVLYVPFREVQGVVPDFVERFIGEGNFNAAEATALLKTKGFTSFLLDDHVQQMDDDADSNHRGRAHAIGHMQGLLKMSEIRA